jgi:hypothetical protein
MAIVYNLDRTRSFKICELYGTSYPSNLRKKTYEFFIQQPETLRYILDMISPKLNFRIVIERGKIIMELTAPSEVVDILGFAIQKLFSYSLHKNLSILDANAILDKNSIPRSDVYSIYVHSSECLIVLENPNHNESDSKKESFLKKLDVIRNAVRIFNESRTVIMTPDQYKKIKETFKKNIEFSSVLPNGKIEVIFKREAINVVPEIKCIVEIETLQERLRELQSLRMKSQSGE